GPDAEKLGKMLGLTVTKMESGGETVSMAGFPHSALEKNLTKILTGKERVAIGDSEDVPAPADKPPDRLPGGKGDALPDAAVPKDQLARGTEVEAEHTTDKGLAGEIARDHLAEDP